MNGVINVYKEKGCTSFHVVAIIRSMMGEKKVGHTGTLDPDATGVLPICLGKATKLMGQLEDTDKVYRAEMLLGISTDTQDISGSVLSQMPADEVRGKVSLTKIQEAFAQMTGEISQMPPMYSAVKVGGVKLVDAARKGKEIERKARTVTVYGFSDISYNEETLKISFEVSCSKGTYVRTICEDIGKLLGVPACLTELERTKAAGLDIESSVKISDLDRLKAEGKLESVIIPVDTFFQNHAKIVIKNDSLRYLEFGNYMYPDDVVDYAGTKGICRVYDQAGNFYALYRFDENDQCYKCEKMFK